MFGYAAAAPMATNPAFSAWMTEHGKQYESATELNMRLAIFEANMQLINEHNAGDSSFTLGTGPFTDLSHEEWNALYSSEFTRTTPRDEVMLPEATADSVDWRTEGAVTPVKNQASCGSCWSFSTTGAIEGAWKVAGNDLVSLSEQQLMDCAGGKYGNKGCQGGSMEEAMKYVKDNNGLDSEKDYPYEAKNGVCDKEKEGTHVAGITGHKDVTQNSMAQLEAAVALGPVSVAIEANKPVFQHYKGGVLDSYACGTKLDHGVLVVGYGTDATSSKDYWIVKNSWGATWGESGYIRLDKGGDAAKTGTCGIQMQPVYATAVKGPAPPPAPPGPAPGGDCDVSPAERTSCGLLLSKNA